MTGHTPQKLPAFAAISCIIAVRAQYPYARSSIIPSFSPFVKDNFRIFYTPFVKDNFRIFYKISIEFLSISQNFLFAHSPFFPLPSSLFLLPYSLFPKIPPASKAPRAIVGVPRQRRGGGIPQAKPAELLPYSLFPKIPPGIGTAPKGSLGKVVLWVSRRYRALERQ